MARGGERWRKTFGDLENYWPVFLMGCFEKAFSKISLGSVGHWPDFLMGIFETHPWVFKFSGRL